MLALLQGNFGFIQGMNRRLKDLLIKEMGNKDTPENRKKLADKECQKFKDLITIPTEILANIHEGFEPLLVSRDTADIHFIKILNTILDFDEKNRTDEEFINIMTDVLSDFIGEWVDELQDGFVNGMQDAVVFFRENFRVLIEAGAGPEFGPMMGGMGINSLMRYITLGYNKYKENKQKRA